MPTKNETTIKWGSGTLYLYPPEGGDPVAVGPVKGLTETIEQEHLVDPFFPAPTTKSLTQTFSFEADLGYISLPKLYRLTAGLMLFYMWAKLYHPRLFHLYAFAKTGRHRTKSLRRLVRMFIKEAFA